MEDKKTEIASLKKFSQLLNVINWDQAQKLRTSTLDSIDFNKIP
jgi:hypothetical protein